jgi:hypothetical protein
MGQKVQRSGAEETMFHLTKRRRFHEIKKGDKGKPKDNYYTDPVEMS